MAWRPLSQRGEVDSNYDALHEGVPPWLRGTVLDWLQSAFRYVRAGSRYVNIALLRETERHLRNVTLGVGDDIILLRRCMDAVENDDETCLDVVDFVVTKMRLDDYQLPDEVRALDEALRQAGSVWRVAHYPEASYACLERRVDETVTNAARQVMSASGRAGEYLAKAWHEAYGRDPSPGEAYRHAVRAVEVVVLPVVIPKDPIGTLGKAITAMRDAPQKWTAELTPTDGSNSVETVAEMLDLLWKSQWDRHGIADESAPLEVSQEEAEAAVHLATTLVQWFAVGTVKSR